MTRFDAAVERALARVSDHWENRLYEEGYRILIEILADEPGYGKAHSYLAWYCFAQVGDYPLAAEHYALALKFNPNFAGTYPNYMHVLIALGRYSEAASLAEASLATGGVDRALMLAEMGRAYELSRDYRMACRAYRRAYYMAENRAMMADLRDQIERSRRKARFAMFGL